MPTKKVKMKLAVTSSEEILRLMDILNELESLYKYDIKHRHLEDIDLSEYKNLKTFDQKNPEQFFEDLLHHLNSIHHQRILWNCDTMLKQCADPKLDHLDFSPEIKFALESVDESKKFYKLVMQTRKMQKEYFRTRDLEVLKKSKVLESLVDAAIDKIENPQLF